MPIPNCSNRKKMNRQIMLTLLLVSTLAVAFNVTPTKASLPVHNINTGLDYATIREAIDAPETQEGHTIKVDAGTYYERFLTISKSNLTILGEKPDTTIIDSNATGDVVYITASNIRISGFTIRNGGWAGIYLNYATSNNNLIGNTIADNSEYGIYADYSTNNTIRGNTVTNNGCGISLWYSSGSYIYHNNFIDKTAQVSNWMSNNTWDNGYPSGGNYWSDYNGTDMYSGRYQNETGSDGIGDTPYSIDQDNQDRYPLMNPWLLGDLGGHLPPKLFKFDGKCDGKDLALFLQCFKGLAPPEAMYLADLGGGLPPKFFNFDGKVDGKDLALFLQCFKGLGP